HLKHQILEDHAQAARAYLALQGKIRDRLERIVGKAQAHVLKFKKPLILAHERVLGFGEDAHQRGLIQIAEHTDDRQAADKFRNQTVANQVGGLSLFKDFDIAARGRGRLRIRVEAKGLLPHPALDNLLESDECPAADEQDVRGIHRRELLVRVLAPALRRHVGHSALEDFQEGLLHAFAGNIAGDGRVFVLLGNFINFVYVYDSLLGLLDVSIGRLQELEDDIFHVLADVAGFGERGGVHDGEGHLKHARERLREQRLAGTGGPDQQDIRFRELDVAGLLVQEDALVMIVDRDRELLLGLLLPDDVAIEKGFDLRRPRQPPIRRRGLLALFVVENLLAYSNALVANIRAWIFGGRADELLDLILRLMTERASQRLFWSEPLH